MNKKRIEWIDNMRGICMLLVILHHAGAPEEYQKFLSPFFLSGFFFISGYLFDTPNKDFDWKLKLIRIFETLVIPYFIYWVISYFFVAGYTEVWKNGNYDIFIPFLKDLLMGKKLWFMSALIVSETVLVFILPMIRRSNIYLIFTALVFIALWYFTPLSRTGVFYPWYINNACIAIFFMLSGILFRKIKILEMNNILFCAAIVYPILFIADIYLDITGIMFASNYFNNILIFIIYAIAGILGLIYLCKRYISGKNLLSYYGKNSLLIYFFCNQIIILCFKITSTININWYIKSLIITLIVCITITIPVYISNRLFPWMCGKFNKISTSYIKRK